MSLNLHHNREHEEGLSIVQIPQTESELIYGDGAHQGICDRLEEYYNSMSRSSIEYEASHKGDQHPFKGKDRKYWESWLEAAYKENHQFIDRLRLLSDVQWSVW